MFDETRNSKQNDGLFNFKQLQLQLHPFEYKMMTIVIKLVLNSMT